MKKILFIIIVLIFITVPFILLQRHKPFKIITGFVKREGRVFTLNGKPFSAIGANNYYAIYKSPRMVNKLFEIAAENNISVMRMWGFLDAGHGSNPTAGAKEGIYFQYWNGKVPVYNDTETGLKKLDYAVYKAKEQGIRLVIPLADNWQEFGGMDQYVKWRGGTSHDEFYTDPVIKQWYKNYVAHILNRTNTYTGIAYKDEPAIMAWELANEPRCDGILKPSEDCTESTITLWAEEMSGYIKSIDKQHLLGAGDEGFYCNTIADEWTEDCSHGVDSRGLADIPSLDYISVHMYPEKWDKTVAWATQWVARHVTDSYEKNKPVLLGEFGLQDKIHRITAYTDWMKPLPVDNSVALVWMLADTLDNGLPYPDYDGYTIYCPGEVCALLREKNAKLSVMPTITTGMVQ